VIGDRDAHPAVAAESLDPRDAGRAVGVVCVNVGIDEQFRLLWKGTIHEVVPIGGDGGLE
jgi:hypothetical protein